MQLTSFIKEAVSKLYILLQSVTVGIGSKPRLSFGLDPLRQKDSEIYF